MSLSEMRKKMALRLGFGSQGSASAAMREVLNEYLQDAQEQLFEYFSDMFGVDYVSDLTLNEGQNLYDITDEADPQRVDDVSIYINGYWFPLKKGLSMFSRSDIETGQPTRYDFKYGSTNEGQIEFQPTPDKEYRIGYVYQRTLGRFTQNQDLCSLPGRMVLTLALGNAAEHYRLPTSGRFIAQANGLLGQMRARANKGIKVTRGTPQKPHSVGRDEFAEKINNIATSQDSLISEMGQYLIAE